MNLLPIPVVNQLIAEYEAHIEAMRPKRGPTPPLEAHQKMDTSVLGRYVARAMGGVYQILATTPAGQSKRYGQFLSSAARLAGIANSDWGAPFLSPEDVYTTLIHAATVNGLVAKYGERHLRRAIDWCLGNVVGRPEPQQGKPFVPKLEYPPYSNFGTSGTDELIEPDDWPHAANLEDSSDEPDKRTTPVDAARLSAEERQELADLFPTPVDGDGQPIKPLLQDIAMVKRGDPRRGASHLIIGNSWSNPTNRQYQRRALYGHFRTKFREHLAAGGMVFHTALTVGTDTADDEEVRNVEKKEWGRIRKRLQREEAIVHWFTASWPEGVSREIFASCPLYDDQEPLADPEVVLLGVLRDTVTLPLPTLDDNGELQDPPPYKRRPAHGGPDDAWRPKKTRTNDWVVVGARPGRALTEMRQDVYDQAVAAKEGVKTWTAGSQEINARSPETVIYTRHWLVPPDKPPDTLVDVWEEVGFTIVAGAREWMLGEAGELSAPT